MHEFKLRDGDSSTPFSPPALTVPRHENAEHVMVGMTAREVLTLLGSPDYVGRDTWSYDMDGRRPYSLTLKWDARRIVSMDRETPALWQGQLVRDRLIVY